MLCVGGDFGCGVVWKKGEAGESCDVVWSKSLEQKRGGLGCGVEESLEQRDHGVSDIYVASSKEAAWVWFGALGGFPENRTHPQQKLLLGVFGSGKTVLEHRTNLS